jgi:prevent-host-death family protein
MVVHVGAFEAKTNLSKLLERVRLGDRVVITLRGVPVAVLVPPGEVERGQIVETIRKLDELRSRTKAGSGSLRALWVAGRRH